MDFATTHDLRFPSVPGALAAAAVMLAAGMPLAGCTAAGPAQPTTDLEIVIRSDGSTVSREYRLRCQAEEVGQGSTLPTAREACALLTSNPSVLAPGTDQNRICTEIYGGPATAEITGMLAGRGVSAVFDRHNGCAIAEWEAAAPLLGDGS